MPPLYPTSLWNLCIFTGCQVVPEESQNLRTRSHRTREVSSLWLQLLVWTVPASTTLVSSSMFYSHRTTNANDLSVPTGLGTLSIYIHTYIPGTWTTAQWTQMPSEYTPGNLGKVFSIGHDLWAIGTDDKALVSSVAVPWTCRRPSIFYSFRGAMTAWQAQEQLTITPWGCGDQCHVPQYYYAHPMGNMEVPFPSI